IRSSCAGEEENPHPGKAGVRVQHSRRGHLLLKDNPEDGDGNQIGEDGDQHDGDEVEPQATLDHLTDLDITGTEGDGIRRGRDGQHEGAGCGQGDRDGQQQNILLATGGEADTYGDTTHNREERCGGGGVGGEFGEEEHQGGHREDQQDDRQSLQVLGQFTDPEGQARLGEHGGQGQATTEEDEHIPGGFIGGLPVQQTLTIFEVCGDGEQEGTGDDADHGIVDGQLGAGPVQDERNENPGQGGSEENDAHGDLWRGPGAQLLELLPDQF